MTTQEQILDLLRRSACAARNVDALRHARSRPAVADRGPGRRHVCGAHRRDRANRRALHASEASLHAGPDRLNSTHRGSFRTAGAAVARAAAAAPTAGRLPLRAALRLRAAACFEERQVLRPVSPSREVACWRWPEMSVPSDARAVAEAEQVDHAERLLAIDNISVDRRRGQKCVLALRDVSLDIGKRETFALVGESGSGKSTIARTVGGLLCRSRADNLSEGRSRAATASNRRTKTSGRDPDRLPEPGCLAQPAPRGVPDRWSRPLELFFGPHGKARRGGVAERSRTCSSTPPAGPLPRRAVGRASGSASRSRARCRRADGCCSATR